jgi:isopentenyldiphosphate isomerase
MSSSVGMMTFPTEWKNKKCSKPLNHQPVVEFAMTQLFGLEQLNDTISL